MMRRSHVALLALGGASVVAGVVAARQEARWRAHTDPDGSGFLDFPEGERLTVTTTDGAELATAVAGEGPTVVLTHGWTNAHSVWSPVARRLVRDGLRVIAYDQRGHGASTVGSEPFSVERLGADLRDVLVALDVKDAVLAGHSMGGMTIMALIAEDPIAVKEHARALILVSTAAGGVSPNPRVDALVARFLATPRLRKVFSGRLGPRLTRGAVGIDPVHEHLAALADMWVTTSPEVIRDAYLAIARMDLRPGLAGCPVPVTVAVGARDRLTRRGLSRVVVDSIPGARLVEYPGAGHMLPFEERDAIAGLIEEAARAS
jgi:pimeloyl-ACP methyl ester carboxylesterase